MKWFYRVMLTLFLLLDIATVTLIIVLPDLWAKFWMACICACCLVFTGETYEDAQ